MVVKLDGGWLGAGGEEFPTPDDAIRSFAKAYRWPEPNVRPERRATTQRLRVFLCHGKEDKPRVRDLHRKLIKAGTEPWLDEADLLPGQKWKAEIQRAISESDAFLACVSSRSITREGYLHREIREALDRGMNMPEGRIFLIPVRLDACKVPAQLTEYQWVDYFEDQGFENLVRALGALAGHLNGAGASIIAPG